MTTSARGLRLPLLLAVLLPAVLLGCRSSENGPVESNGPDSPGPRTAHGLTPAEFWNASTIYFLLTDRFRNGDPSNDNAVGRPSDHAVLRGFHGGDLAGLRDAIEEGYFDRLGVDAIWLTPFVEQIRGGVDEGTGKSYGFHGYWARDWTRIEPNLGTEADLRAVVDAAHARGIRVLMDAVINHTGPVTPLDPQWPTSWVRTGPRCTYQDYETTVECTLVDNLPDILTGKDAPVELPAHLTEKWAAEGRLAQETAELDTFFERTGYPRAPRYYLIKWLTDWVREMGFDGYRVDTAKHFQEDVSVELRREAEHALAEWRASNAAPALGSELPFYMMGEVYGWVVEHGHLFPFGGGTSVDFFAHGYDGLINFGFKRRDLDPATLYADYASRLRDQLEGQSAVNYASSHDDPEPFDRDRTDPYGTATRLLLAPGAAQIYYGDEVARPLQVPGAVGDAHLRSPMDWSFDAVESEILEHWRALGRFRAEHPAVGAGRHIELRKRPYVFGRVLEVGDGADRVLVGLDHPPGPKTLPAGDLFPEGTALVDAYSGVTATVEGGVVSLDTPASLVLLAPAG